MSRNPPMRSTRTTVANRSKSEARMTIKRLIQSEEYLKQRIRMRNTLKLIIIYLMKVHLKQGKNQCNLFKLSVI